jgi:hypothetical protein
MRLVAFAAAEQAFNGNNPDAENQLNGPPRRNGPKPRWDLSQYA